MIVLAKFATLAAIASVALACALRQKRRRMERESAEEVARWIAHIRVKSLPTDH